MIIGWIEDHPKTIAMPCLSCATTLDVSTVVGDRHRCELCAGKALKLLSTVLYYDCMTWICTNASDHVAAIRELMAKSVDGGAKKKQKTAAVPAAKAAAKAKGASNGKSVRFFYSCALCVSVCGEDCVGVSKSQAPELGSVVFHKACRDKVFASKWRKSLRSKCVTLSLSKNKQWQLIAAKANSCRLGVEFLTPETGNVTSEASKTSALSVEATKRLAAEASLTGDDTTSALYSGMAKWLEKNSGEATACEEDLR